MNSIKAAPYQTITLGYEVLDLHAFEAGICKLRGQFPSSLYFKARKLPVADFNQAESSHHLYWFEKPILLLLGVIRTTVLAAKRTKIIYLSKCYIIQYSPFDISVSDWNKQLGLGSQTHKLLCLNEYHTVQFGWCFRVWLKQIHSSCDWRSMSHHGDARPHTAWLTQENIGWQIL